MKCASVRRKGRSVAGRLERGSPGVRRDAISARIADVVCSPSPHPTGNTSTRRMRHPSSFRSPRRAKKSVMTTYPTDDRPLQNKSILFFSFPFAHLGTFVFLSSFVFFFFFSNIRNWHVTENGVSRFLVPLSPADTLVRCSSLSLFISSTFCFIGCYATQSPIGQPHWQGKEERVGEGACKSPQ